MNYPALLEQVAEYVRNYMQQHDNPAFLYHNLPHTESVVAAAYQIISHYPLSERDQFIAIAAAWFHDVGYFEDIFNHEAAGAKHAGDFLEKAGVEAETISSIKKCILTTKMPQSATNLPEQIVCDADLFNLGTEDFTERGKQLRKEYNILHNTPVSKEEWRKKTIHLLENHRYFTTYCSALLEETKAKNLEKLRNKTAEQQSESATIAHSPEHTDNDRRNEDKGNKKKDERPERTIETMFRVTSTNSQRLSDQADTKANILITVNSIIVSVLLTVFVQKDYDYTNLSLPLGMLLIVNLATIVFSILATRPNIPNGTFTRDDLTNRSANLLFFGNFYRMKFNDYSDGMFQIMNDKKYLHTTLLRDIYHQGVVLGRKYRLLKIAYNVFMFGLIISVLAFFIVSKYYSDNP